MIRLQTQFNSQYPPKADYPKNNIVLQPEGTSQFMDHQILIGQRPNKTLAGEIDYFIRYGKPNYLKFSVSGKKLVTITFDNLGNARDLKSLDL